MSNIFSPRFNSQSAWRIASVLWCCVALISCKVDVPNAPVPTKQLWQVWKKDFPSTRLSLSPDGQILVAYRGNQNDARPNGVGRYRAFNASTGVQVQLPIPDTANELKFSPDGKYCAAQMGERINIYEMQTGEVIRSIYEWGLEDPVISYAWIDNQTLATGYHSILTLSLFLRNIKYSGLDEFIEMEDFQDYLSDESFQLRKLRDGFLQLDASRIIDIENRVFIRGPYISGSGSSPNVDASTWFSFRGMALVLVNQSGEVQWTIPVALDKDGEILSTGSSSLQILAPRVSASGRYATVTGWYFPNEYSPYLFVFDTQTGEHLVHIPLGAVMDDVRYLGRDFDVVFDASDEHTLFTILDGHIVRWRIE